jgi:hypothetical protein
MLRWRFSIGTGEGSMSANLTLAFEKKFEAQNTEAKDIWAVLLLVPTAMCLFSILLAVESPAFASAVTLLGLE